MEAKLQELAEVVSHLTRVEVFHVGPISVTSTVVNTWIVMAVLFAVVLILRAGLKERPGGAQAFLEVVVEFCYSLIDTSLGKPGRKYLPIIGTLFSFILFMNLSWFIPGMVPPTTDIMTTAALAITTIVIVQVVAMNERGVVGYLRHFTEPVIIMTPMNLLEEVVKPFSLAVRLFGNMFGEKMVVTILFILIPVFVPIPVMALGILFGVIQAFIFSLLTVTYLATATHGH